MSEDPHDLGKTVRLHHVEKFEGLHLEAEFGIHAKQDQVGYLGRVEHGRGAIGTFQKGHPSSFGGAHRNRTDGLGQIAIGVELDQTPYQGGLAHARRSHHGDERGRPFLRPGGAAVGQGDVFFLLGAVEVALDVALGANDVGDGEGAGVVAGGEGVGLFGLEEFFLFAGAAARFGGLVGTVGLVVGGCGCGGGRGHGGG